jgi:hypothetical protein
MGLSMVLTASSAGGWITASESRPRGLQEGVSLSGHSESPIACPMHVHVAIDAHVRGHYLKEIPADLALFCPGIGAPALYLCQISINLLDLVTFRPLKQKQEHSTGQFLGLG